MIGQVDLTFINDDTLREIYSIRTPLASMIEKAARTIARVKRRGDVVLTLGEFGAIVFRKSGGPPIEVPALRSAGSMRPALAMRSPEFS